MRNAVALARFELFLRPWPLALGLGVGILALVLPGFAQLGISADVFYESATVFLLPAVAAITALLLGAGTAAGDRAGDARFLLARPLRATLVIAIRLMVHLGLALAAGFLAALPLVTVGLRASMTSPRLFMPEFLATAPAATTTLALLALLALRLLAEQLAAAATDRSYRLAVDLLGLGAAAWLASSVAVVMGTDPYAARLRLAALVLGVVGIFAALLAATWSRLAHGRGDAPRGHLIGALAAIAVLGPSALLAGAWADHVWTSPRASELALDRHNGHGFYPTRFPGLVVVSGLTPLRFDLVASTLLDVDALDGGEAPRFDWAVGSIRGSVAVGLQALRGEGVGVSILRRRADGRLATTSTPLVLPGPWRVRYSQRATLGHGIPSSELAVDEAGARLLRVSASRLELWDLTSGALIADAKIDGFDWNSRVWIGPNGAKIADVRLGDTGDPSLSICGLSPGQPLHCEETALAGEGHVRLFEPLADGRLAVSYGQELLVLTSDGAVAWRHRFSEGVEFWVGQTPDGSLAAYRRETVVLFANDGSILVQIALPHANLPCGWLGDELVVGSYSGPGDLVRVGLDGQLRVVSGQWQCEAFSPYVAQSVLLRDTRGVPAAWRRGEPAPRSLPALLSDPGKGIPPAPRPGSRTND